MSKLNLVVRSGKYTTKFRIVKAIEDENILLLTKLMNILKHPPDAPVDKLGSNILHMACYLGKLNILKFIFANYNLSLNEYNTEGVAPIHLAVKSCSFKVVSLLWLTPYKPRYD